MSVVNHHARLFTGCATSLAAVLLLDPARPALAQTAPQAVPAQSEVVVTGSRIARTGFSTPVPVTVVGADQIGQEAATSIATVVQQLPEFRPVTSPLSVSANNQNVGAATADLRGLSANRTLVLVDGERFVGSTVANGGGTSQTSADAVDLSLLPTSIVLRTEIVTGGASASYGSDAVAGVVNVILDNKLTGFKGQAQYSETQYGDSIEYQASAAYGADFMGGKGHFVVSGEYVDNQGVNSRLDNGRSWSTQQNLPASVSNPCPIGSPVSKTCPTGGNGLPATVVSTNAENATYAVGGLIASGPLAGMVFNTPNAISPFQYGYYLGKGAGMAGGQGPNSFNEYFKFEAPITHYSLYGHGNYDFSDSLTGHVSVTYGDSRSSTPTIQPRWITLSGAAGSSTLYIQPGNAFLPTGVPGGFYLGLLDDAYGPAVQSTERSTFRISAGLDGKFNLIGDKPWTWNAYYQYGQANYSLVSTNADNWQNFLNATDAVVVTPANVGSSGLAVGSVACRTTLTNPANGCVPYNPFGNQVPSAAARAYISGTQWNKTEQTLNVVSGQVQGDIFNLPAGPVTLAVGGEYRVDTVSGSEDPISAVSGWQTLVTVIANGSENVKEGFGELAIPVLKDIVLAKNLNLDGAFRYTDYSTSGGITSWKMGAVDDVFDWLRVRGTWSRDIRAPNVWDLFQTDTTHQTVGTDPLTGQGVINQTTGGNANLKPEIGYTFTGGFIVTAPPNTWFRSLRFSVDYFHIKIDDAITAVTVAQTISNCEQKNSAASCALITRDASAGVSPTGIPYISNLLGTEVNIASLTTAGVDVELDYRKPLSDFAPGLPGTLDFHLVGTHTMELTQDVVGILTYNAGVSGQEPWWGLNGGLTYTNGPLTIGGTGRFISDQIISSTQYAPCQGAAYTAALAVPGETNTTTLNCIGSYAVFGLNAAYNIDYRGGRIQLYTTIDNIFDRPPPFDTAGFASGVGPQYDLLGRNFHFGVRVRY